MSQNLTLLHLVQSGGMFSDSLFPGNPSLAFVTVKVERLHRRRTAQRRRQSPIVINSLQCRAVVGRPLAKGVKDDVAISFGVIKLSGLTRPVAYKNYWQPEVKMYDFFCMTKLLTVCSRCGSRNQPVP